MSEEKSPGRGGRTRWEAGKSGNPAGGNPVDRGIKTDRHEAASPYRDAIPRVLAVFLEILEDKTAPPRERIRAGEAINNRALGNPKSYVHVESKKADEPEFVSTSSMTFEQLRTLNDILTPTPELPPPTPNIPTILAEPTKIAKD